ncbi:MAG: hypothetical protein ACE5OZ_15495 [Candidatus Heimdallarchaeota archaeon]
MANQINTEGWGLKGKLIEPVANSGKNIKTMGCFGIPNLHNH